MTELARLEASVQGQAEVQERMDLVGEEWVAPGLAQVQGENVRVQTAERLSLMKQERRAPL